MTTTKDTKSTKESENEFCQNVNSVPTIESDVLVLNRLRMLELEWDSVALPFMSQALVAGGFQQRRTPLSVSFDRTANHAIGEIVEFHLRALRGNDLCGNDLCREGLYVANERLMDGFHETR